MARFTLQLLYNTERLPTLILTSFFKLLLYNRYLFIFFIAHNCTKLLLNESREDNMNFLSAHKLLFKYSILISICINCIIMYTYINISIKVFCFYIIIGTIKYQKLINYNSFINKNAMKNKDDLQTIE